MPDLIRYLSFLSKESMMNEKLERFHYGVKMKNLPLGDNVFRMGISATSEKTVRVTGTEQFVISWILSGTGRFTENGCCYPIDSGTVCVRRPEHDYRYELDACRSVRLFIELPCEIYHAMLILIPELASLDPVKSAPFHEALWAEFMSLLETFNNCEPDALYTLLPSFFHFISGVTGILDERDKQPMHHAKRLLEDVSSTLTLEEIAGRCEMNYHTFRREFTREFGISPGKYRQSKRIEAACRMLSAGESVVNVAEQVGYPDVYTFTHRFTAVMGTAPSRYREDAAKNQK